ncbi:MAG: PPOX class F420-dependent oxidoreductase [Acidimicrobiia bacterium]|nr:PPOX class F420-dependent oxidoreductase [Acidimicrobiia bacterium]
MELPQEIRDALDEKVFVHLATINPDGSPHVSAVWITRDGDKVLFSSATGRVKPRNIANDPRVALSFSPPSKPYKNFTLRGTVTKTAEDGKWLINSLSDKYLGKPDYKGAPGEVRVNYEITIDNAGVWG